MSETAEVEPEILAPEEPKRFRYKPRANNQKLDPRNDPGLYQRIFDLARMRLTQAEAAVILQVATVTLEKFLARDPDARDAWDAGTEMCKVSVKRLLLVHAKDDPATTRYLANNWLGMSNDPSKNRAIEAAGPGNTRGMSREEAMQRITELQAIYKDITPKPKAADPPKALASRRKRQQ